MVILLVIFLAIANLVDMTDQLPRAGIVPISTTQMRRRKKLERRATAVI
jgi:hypothetical protein